MERAGNKFRAGYYIDEIKIDNDGLIYTGDVLDLTGGAGGIIRSDDVGQTWVNITDFTLDNHLYAFEKTADGILYYMNLLTGQLYTTEDDENWTAQVIPEQELFSDMASNALGHVYATGNSGITFYGSIDQGLSWFEVPFIEQTNQIGHYSNVIIPDDQHIYLASRNHGFLSEHHPHNGNLFFGW